MQLTTDKALRKEQPITRGVLDYFGLAIAEVARVSYIGNKQHNPGEEMYWAKGKSTDHADCIARHLIERGTMDDDGLRHSAKVAWRALAMLQIELEAGKAPAPNRFVIQDSSEAEHQRRQICGWSQTERMSGFAGCTRVEGHEGPCAHPLNALTTHDPEVEAAVRISQNGIRPDDAVRSLLSKIGCPAHIADQIVGGTTYSKEGSEHFVYVAGPMRGLPKFNFPAFDGARDKLLANHWNVISPADIDRFAGDENSDDQKLFCLRDFFSIYFLANHKRRCALAMLSGWENSVGAVAEFFLARWLKLPVLNAYTHLPLLWEGVDTQALLKSVRHFLEGQAR